MNRGRLTVWAMMSSMTRILLTGVSGSSAATTACRLCVISRESALDRTIRDISSMAPTCCGRGRYSVVPSFAGPCQRTSETTPTTVRQGSGSFSLPGNRMRRPTALVFGHHASAKRSLTSTTRCAPATSSSVKGRPATIDTPSVFR